MDTDATLRQLLTGLMSNIPFGIVVLDEDGLVSVVNQHALRLLGHENKAIEKLVDASYEVVFQHIPEIIDKYERMIVSNRHRHFEMNNNTLNDRDLIIQCRTMLKGVLVIVQDVTEIRNLKHHSSHDGLTELVNRQNFESRLTNAYDKFQKNKLPGAVLFIDLDRFKPINDVAGHKAGDDILKKAATVLQSRTRSRDTCARLGGDEFAVILEDCALPFAQKVAETIRDDIEQMSVTFNGRVLKVSASIGIAPFNTMHSNAQSISNAADRACQISKNSGRNQVHVIDGDMDEYKSYVQQVQWTELIKEAIEKDSFALFGQLIKPVDVSDEHSHYEILLRLPKKDGGFYPPNAFIPVAERYQLMSQIDRWVLMKAFSLATDKARFAINLSGQTISESSLATYIDVLMEKFSVVPENITFEITETSAIENMKATHENMQKLREKGFKFALDDFGTGFATFNYLSKIAVDFIKIDGAFVKDVDSNSTHSVIVKSINQVGKSLGVKTIAECVENQATMELLAKYGVDYVQGYHLHKPEPIEQLLQGMEHNAPTMMSA